MGVAGAMKYRIIEGFDKMEINEIMLLLKQAYWADKRSEEQVVKSARNSQCFGIYLEEEKRLAGFARVITDFATTYYLCDVIIDTQHRHKGLGIALISHIEDLPELKGLRGILITRDAHAFYERFGYRILNGKAMEKSVDC